MFSNLLKLMEKKRFNTSSGFFNPRSQRKSRNGFIKIRSVSYLPKKPQTSSSVREEDETFGRTTYDSFNKKNMNTKLEWFTKPKKKNFRPGSHLSTFYSSKNT